MGLHLHRADRTDLLAEGLAGLLAVPPEDPFASDVVAVPAKGIERWLSQRLSHRLGATVGRADGVCAAVDFRTPWSLVAEITGTGDADPWAPPVLAWPVLAAIDDSLDQPWAAPLARHLGDRDDELRRGRRLALARRLAGLFGSYAAQRPTVLVAWEGGHDSDGLGEPVPPDLAWQPALWRAVVARVDAPTPATRHTDVLAALRDRPGTVALPARLSLFGHTRLSATDVELLGALGRHRDVHLWLPHPSPALWQTMAEAGCDRPVRRRADRSHELVAHSLLAGLGRDVRELQRTLGALEATTGAVADDLLDAPPDGATSLLRWLQADLRVATPPDAVVRRARVLPGDDRSVQVHACHGPVRQVEVLREVLLGLLADDPTLEPRDILVMCPDIEAYAPLVSASFGLGQTLHEHGHPGHQLRVQLADRALRQTNPLLGVIGRLLDLAGGRAKAGEVLDLAATAPVRRRFGFDDDDLEVITEWVAEAGVRWGFDAAHRADVGLGAVPQNTWRLGLDRVLAGVAMSDDTGSWLGPTLPLDGVDSSAVELAGRLAEFVDRLAAVTDALVGTHPLQHWITTLGDALERLTAVGATEHWQLGQAQRELARIGIDAGLEPADEGTASTIASSASSARSAAAGPRHTGTGCGSGPVLRLADVRAMLADRLAGRPTRASFRTGTLTICTMVPMRSVPHRVVCLLGLDDGVFPRTGSPDGDDLLARDPVTGERDVRSEDRQLLLDAILAATETLVVTYTGADPHTGTRRPPAVPLGEVLDALDETATVAGPATARVRDRVVVHHPLQPFDARNLTAGALGSPGPFSFDAASLAGAREAAAPRRAVELPFAHRLAAPEPAAEVSLDELVDFVRRPIRHLLGPARLDLALPRDVKRVGEAIPLSVDRLDEWAVGDRLLTDTLAGHCLDAAMHREWRRGTLPPGQLGWAVLKRVREQAEPIARDALSWRVDDPVSVDVDVELGTQPPRRVVGTVPQVFGSLLVSVGFSRLKAADRLAAWVRVLALTATDPEGRWSARTIGRARHGRVEWATVGPIDPTLAAATLTDLVTLRDLGLHQPLPLPSKASAEYAALRHRGSREAVALAAARQQWSGKYGENADAAYRFVWGERAVLPGQEPPAEPGDHGSSAAGVESTRFGALAMRLWAPLLAVETRGRSS